MFKTTLKKYLLQQPSLFSWLTVLICLAMLFYLCVGLAALIWPTPTTWEGVMAFLFIPSFIISIIIVATVDTIFRKITKGKMRIVWIIEISIILGGVIWYSYKDSFRSQIVTKKYTPLVILVEDSINGKSIKQNWLHPKKKYIIGNDNLLIIKEPFEEKEYVNLTAITASGEKYKSIYDLSYTQIDTVKCNDHIYKFHLFILESDSIPRFRMKQNQFDSIRQRICKHLKN